MLRVASSGEGIWGFGGNDINLGHGQAEPPGHPLDDLKNTGQLLPGDRLGAVHGQRELVGIEIADEVHGRGDEKGEHHSIPSAEPPAQKDEEKGESRK